MPVDVSGFPCDYDGIYSIVKKHQNSFTPSNEKQKQLIEAKQLKVEEPPVRQGGVMVADVKELIQKLKYEAKVI